MISLASYSACTGCSACVAVCPKQALTMHVDAEGFLRPQLNAARCIRCHACERVCPLLHPSVGDDTPICYAARINAIDIRRASSSGGLFTALAHFVLKQGGVVFGCRLDASLVASHTKVETFADLEYLRGSKYVQSDLKDTFREVKAFLHKGRRVLFSGTPCQIAGLNRFIGTASPLLLTVEVICHGAPSPGVFEAFKAILEKNEGQRLLSFTFRDTSTSWRESVMTYSFEKGNTRIEPLYANVYIKAFLNDLSLRPSCYQCPAKGGRSQADVTIADFWGIEAVAPHLDDDKGVSAILIHTPQGMQAWEAIRAMLAFEPVSYDAVVAKNPSYYRPVTCPKGRAYFMKHYASKPMDKVYYRALYGSWITRLMHRCKSFASRLLRGLKRKLKAWREK